MNCESSSGFVLTNVYFLHSMEEITRIVGEMMVGVRAGKLEHGYLQYYIPIPNRGITSKETQRVRKLSFDLETEIWAMYTYSRVENQVPSGRGQS